MMRLIKGWAALFALVLVAACGGGGGSGGDPIVGGGDGGGGGGGGGPTAADLSLVLSDDEVQNAGSNVITATVTAVDGNRNAIAGIPITISVDSDAVATVSDSETDEDGVISADITIGANRANRVITVTAVSGSLTKTASFRVTGAKLSATPLPAVLTPGQAGTIEFRLTNATSNPMSGEALVITSFDGVETSATTGTNGEFSFDYKAPDEAGPIEIRAAAGGTTVSISVNVQAGTGTVPVAVGPVQSSSIAINPSVVSVNSEGTSNRSEVRALFLAAGNRPIKNVRVRFDLNGDPLTIGGSITTTTSVVYSDSSGVATSAYVPGDRSSPPDGVEVRACWSLSDFPAGTCPNQVVGTLTVISEPLSVSIGTDATLQIGPSKLDYIKRFVVQVVDAAGQAKANVQISAPVDLLRYRKGFWVISGQKWIKYTPGETKCDNEDLNRNGSIDVYSNGADEDANGNGTIQPRKADVSVSFEGSSQTNSSGQVVLKLTYPQNLASWVDYNLTVSAAGVSGSEGEANFQGTLPTLAEEVNDVQTDIPFEESPYGIETSPIIVVTPPAGQGRQGLLCTNPN